MSDAIRNIPARAWAAFIHLRVPFTLVNVLLLAAAAIWSRTATSVMPAEGVVRYGFAPSDLLGKEWSRAFTSVYFTGGAVTFWMAAILLMALLGATEALWGSRRVAALFVGSHLLTVLAVLALAAALMAGGVSLGSLLYGVRDVGPSAGYVGCLGALLLALPPRWRRWALALAAGSLLFALGQTLAAPVEEAVEISAAVTHVFALVFGVIIGLVLRGGRRHTRAKDAPASVA